MDANNYTTVNLIDKLKSISEKDRKNYGIWQAGIECGDLFTVSNYELIPELKSDIENELKEKDMFELSFEVTYKMYEKESFCLYDIDKFSGKIENYINEIEYYLHCDKECFKSVAFIKESIIKNSLN